MAASYDRRTWEAAVLWLFMRYSDGNYLLPSRNVPAAECYVLKRQGMRERHPQRYDDIKDIKCRIKCDGPQYAVVCIHNAGQKIGLDKGSVGGGPYL